MSNDKSIEQQIADERADIDYAETRIAKWEQRLASAAIGSYDEQLAERRLASLNEERREAKANIARLKREAVSGTVPTASPDFETVLTAHGADCVECERSAADGRSTAKITGSVGAIGQVISVGPNKREFHYAIVRRLGVAVLFVSSNANASKQLVDEFETCDIPFMKVDVHDYPAAFDHIWKLSSGITPAVHSDLGDWFGDQPERVDALADAVAKSRRDYYSVTR